MSQSGHPISPPPVVSPSSASANTGGVRRHHTITAASRVSRPTSKIDIAELEDPQTEQLWHDDEEVDHDWVGGIGAVGEKSSLHRQASLPTRYHRAFNGGPTRQPNAIPPRALNSLSAIAGHEGEEEEWEREMRGLRSEDEHALSSSDHGQQGVDQSSSSASPLSPQYSTGLPHDPSPPPAGSDYAASVRRHQSLNYPNATAARRFNQGLKRAGTLQAQPVKGQMQGMSYGGARSPSPTTADDDYDDESVPADEDAYYAMASQQGQGQAQGQYSPIGRSSPWHTPSASITAQFVQGNNAALDDVSRALSALEINQQYGGNGGGFQQPQSAHPPRFHPSHAATPQASGIRNGSTSSTNSSRAAQNAGGFVPPIGSGLQRSTGHSQQGSISEDMSQRDRTGGFSASASSWEQKERLLGNRTSNASLHGMYQGQGQGQQGKMGGPGNGSNIPGVPPIPPQYLNQGQMPRFGVSSPTGSSGGNQGEGPGQENRSVGQGALQNDAMGNIITPLDVPTLIAIKGYNPPNFDTRPLFAKYFVIKSYTEDDVHKSLKHEIWSSTDPGNKRLDKAFKECNNRGPIYLFFSVNASGHFCGMAEMLTPVDYTQSSTVWASDKWKGVFKVRWIYVRDIPNANLRHIRLNNTQERKPVTNSRDTQELLPDAGQEMLRIFHSHPARTSLLQDFAFYEMQALQKAQQQQTQGNVSPHSHTPMGMQSPGPQSQGISPTNSAGQHPFAMANPSALAYAAQHMGMPGMNMNMNLGMGMNPMLQMQMNMNNMSNAFANPQAMQNMMRHPSPGPMPVGQNFMGMGGMSGF